MSYGKKIRQQLNNQQDSQQNLKAASMQIAEQLGFVVRGGMAAITQDIVTLLQNNEDRALEGYLTAIHRIVSHELAWDCIQTAFTKTNKAIPNSLYVLFGQKQGVINPVERPVVK